MPILKNISHGRGETMITEKVNVNERGNFTIKSPDPGEPWITGKTLKEVEDQWHQTAERFQNRNLTTRKVIIVQFKSFLREGGSNDPFPERSHTLSLLAAIAEETTTKIGDNITLTYADHPDHANHRENPHPIPESLRLTRIENSDTNPDRTIIAWSPEAQEIIVKLCTSTQLLANTISHILISEKMLNLYIQEDRQSPFLKAFLKGNTDS